MSIITIESKAGRYFPLDVPETSGNFCNRGGRFGTHSSNENLTPIYYKRVLFIAHFNAGVRAPTSAIPFNPKEIGYYIRPSTAKR